MAVMNEKVGRMLKKRQGIESEYSQVSEPEAEFSTQQYRPYQGNYEWESPMNQKVQDLLEKRAPKWYEPHKATKQMKDNRQYSYFGKELEAGSPGELYKLAEQYAESRYRGRTTEEADAWRKDRELANAMGNKMDPPRYGAAYLPSYLTGESRNTSMPYAAGPQADMEENRRKKTVPEDTKRKENLPGTMQQDYNHLWNLAHIPEYANRTVMSRPDFQEISKAGEEISPLFSSKEGKSTFDLYREALGLLQERQHNLAYMTDDEKAIYNYKVGKEGKDAGRRYLESISDELNQRSIHAADPQIRNYSKEHPIQGAIANLGISLMTPAGYVKALKKNADGKELDPYDLSFSPAYMERAAREGIKENTGSLGDFMIDTGLSIGQTALRLPLGNAGLAVAAGGAGSGTLLDSLERGGSDSQALLNATFAAGAEAFFEKFSLEGLEQLKTAPVKSMREFLKNLAKQSFTEGSEEAFTEIANSLTDEMVMGELSNYHMALDQYRKNGMTEKEARARAFTDILKNIGLAGLGGAVSGGMMGGGTMALNGMNSYRADASVGKTLHPDYRDYAGSIDTDEEHFNSYQDYQRATELQKTAEEYAARQRQGEFITNRKKGAYDRALNEYISELAEHHGMFETGTETGMDHSYESDRKVDKINSDQDPVMEPVQKSVQGPVKELETENERPWIEPERIQNPVPMESRGTESSYDILEPWAEVYGAKGKKAFKESYDGNAGIEAYYKAFSRYYNAGRYNMDMQDAKTMFSTVLTPDQAAEAYKAGAQDRNIEIGYDPETGEIRNMVQKEPKTGGLVEAAVEATEAQKKAAEAFGKRTGLSFVLVDDVGSGAAASYEKGKVKISINSKNFNASISHELTHFIQEYSPDLYTPYQDIAVKALTQAENVSFEDLMESYSRSYERAGKRLSRAEIIDEIVADATEKFFNDPDYVNEIVHRNRTLGEKILAFLNDIVDALKSLMKTGSVRKAAKGLEENVESYTNARNIWMAALEEAGDRYQSGMEKEGISQEETEYQKLRYQLEDIEDYQGVYLELLYENEDLREGIRLMQKEFELTGKEEMRQEDIKKIARNVVKTYQSTANVEMLERNLTKFYEIIRSSDQIDGREVAEVAADIARSVLKQSRQVEEGLTQAYKDLRKQIREIKIKITDQDKADFMEDGDYNGFRKRYFGKMKLGKEGISIDSFYEELSDQHPELFDRSITHPADRLKQIGNVVDLTQEQIVNPYHANMDEMAYLVGQELINSYFDVRNPKPTFADKKAAEIERVKREYKKRLDHFKQSRIAQYEAVIGEQKREMRAIRDAHKQELIVQQQKFSQKMQQRRESERIRTAKKRIIKEVNTMKTWLLKPNDTKHVPQELRGIVAGFLSSIDYSSDDPLVNRSREWEKTKRAMASIRDSGMMIDDAGKSHYIDMDPDLIGRFEELTKKVEHVEKLDDLDAYSMEELQKVVISMKKALTEVNELKSNKKSRQVSLLAEEVFHELDSMKDKTEYTGVFMGTADKLFNYDMLDPLTMFGIMGDGMKSTYDSLRKGFDKKTLLMKTTHDYIKNLMNETGISQQEIRKIAGKDAEPVKFKVTGGTISLTIPQIMSLYELNKRNQARGHLYDRQGGIKPQSRDRGMKVGKEGIEPAKREKSRRSIKVTEADVMHITNTLTAEQKALADGMQRFMGKEIAAWGNEVSMELYGYEKFTAKDYFPIKADKNYLVSKEGTEENQSIKHLGMTKSVIEHAHNPLIIEDIFDVFTRQADQMSSYHAYVVPLSDLHKVYNYMDMRGLNGSTIKEAIDRKFGKEGGNYIVKLIEDINGSVHQDRSIGEKFMSNMKAASVAGNLRVAIQQPTAYVRAAMEIDPKYLARGMATITEKEQWEKICQYAPIAQWKEWGFYRMEVSRQMKDIIMGTDSRKQRFVNATMMLAEKGDKIAWNRLWRACEYECMDRHPELKKGTEEFYEQVGERFSEIIDKTQVADSVLHRTQIMRSENGFNKMATSFMAEPLKNYNMLYRAEAAVVQKKTGAKKRMVRAAGVFTASNFMTAAAAAVIDAMRDDDKDKKWIEKYQENVRSNFIDGMNPLTYIPYVKDVTSIIQGYTPGRADLSAFQDIKYALDKIEKLYQGDSKLTPQYVILYTAQACSKLTGIPIKSIMREAEGLINTAVNAMDGKADYEWTKQKYEIRNKENLKRYAKIMLEAYEGGNAGLAKEIKEDLNQAGIDNESISRKLNTIVKSELINDTMVDPDVDRAAEALMKMDVFAYEEAYDNLKKAGYADKLIKSVIEKRVRQLSGGKEAETDPEIERKTEQEALYDDILDSGEGSYVSKYTLSELKNAADLFDGTDMKTEKAFETVAGEILKEKMEKGKTKKEAVSEIRQVLTGKYKPLWQQGNAAEKAKIMAKVKLFKVNGEYLYQGYDFRNWREK